MKEVQEMEEEKRSKYLDMLATRLVEARESKGISQKALAEIIGVQREKINYTELKIKGRKLQIEELAEIADVLNVSMDYLVGRTSNKDTTNNSLTNNSNVIIEEWGDNKLGIFDSMIKEFNYEFAFLDILTYSYVKYIRRNVLTDTIDTIKSKVEQGTNIQNKDINKIEFLKEYIQYFQYQKSEYYDYIEFLVSKHNKEFIDASNECDKIRQYNSNKNVTINFDTMLKLRKVLEQFEEKLLSMIIEGQMRKVIINMTDSIANDDNCYNEIMKYIKSE